MAKSPFPTVDLRRPKESLSEKTVGQIKPSPYSYEHRISLDQDTLDKLGVDIPKVGDHFHVLGHGEVVSVNSNHEEGGKKTTRVSLQMKRLGLKPKESGDGGIFGAVNDGIKQADEDNG